MSKFLYWLFSKTALGHVLDGNKRLIGFFIWLLGFLAQGLAIAGDFFPNMPILGQFSSGLQHFLDQLAPILKDTGLGVMAVGVASKAAKEKVEGEAGD